MPQSGINTFLKNMLFDKVEVMKLEIAYTQVLLKLVYVWAKVFYYIVQITKMLHFFILFFLTHWCKLTTSMSCAMERPKWISTTSEMFSTGRDSLL